MLYTQNLIKDDLTKYYKKPIDFNTEPVTNRPMRSAAKKGQDGIKNVFLNRFLSFQ